jgi:CRP/FNR family transcriptional regulator
VYAVITGLVQVSRMAAEGHRLIVDLYGRDDLFGEGALTRLPRDGEQAMAVEKTTLMSWTADELEQLIERRPALALAFVKMMARRNAEYLDRLQSVSHENVSVRLAWALLRFSQRFGTPAERGTVCMRSFPHELLAQYIVTSRELVNRSMTEFRKLQLLTYSRQGITLHPIVLPNGVEVIHAENVKARKQRI